MSKVTKVPHFSFSISGRFWLHEKISKWFCICLLPREVFLNPFLIFLFWAGEEKGMPADAQEFLLALALHSRITPVLRGPFRMLRIKSRLVVCKATALPTML